MKRLFLSLFILVCIYCTYSCTKANNVTTTIRDTTVVRDTTISIVRDTVYLSPKRLITGTWTGIYRVNGLSGPDSFSYTFFIRPDDTLTTIGNGFNGTAGYAYGWWKLTGTTFTATISDLDGVGGNVQNITAAYDSVNGILNGTFLDVAGTNHDAGTLRLKKAQ
jgi:hypothetical protein